MSFLFEGVQPPAAVSAIAEIGWRGDAGDEGHGLVAFDRRSAITLGGLMRGLSADELLPRRLSDSPGDVDFEGLRELVDRMTLATSSLASSCAPSGGRLEVLRFAAADQPIREDGGRWLEMHLVAEPGLSARLSIWCDDVVARGFEGLAPSEAVSEAVAVDELLSQGITVPATAGRLGVFCAGVEALDTVRRAARRVGLEFVERGGAEAPNPSDRSERFVLLDVPVGAERRFDWCRRYKSQRPDVSVALLVHHPSRSRVLQGFTAGADAILGWPIDEFTLAVRLRDLVGQR